MENNFAFTEKFNNFINGLNNRVKDIPAYRVLLMEAFIAGARSGTAIADESEAVILDLKKLYYQLKDGTFTSDTVDEFKLNCLKYEQLTGTYPTADMIDPPFTDPNPAAGFKPHPIPAQYKDEPTAAVRNDYTGFRHSHRPNFKAGPAEGSGMS